MAETEKAEITAKIEASETKVKELTEENKILLSKIQKYEQPTHGTLLKEPEQQMSEIYEKIIKLLFDNPLTVEQICKILKISKSESNYYLHDLCDKKLVNSPPRYFSGTNQWHINQNGKFNYRGADKYQIVKTWLEPYEAE